VINCCQKPFLTFFESLIDESNPSPNKGPITRGMLKNIQNASDDQDPSRPNGIKLPFKWAKEDIKINI